VSHRCFECGAKAECAHHVVPKSLGGSRTLPLCLKCHEKAHMSLQELIRAGMERARAEGKQVGGAHKLSRSDRRLVRRLAAEGIGTKRLASAFGVCSRTIRRIKAAGKADG